MVKYSRAMGEFLDTPESLQSFCDWPSYKVTVKNLHWSIGELMEGSPHKNRFIPLSRSRRHFPNSGTAHRLFSSPEGATQG